MKIILYYYSGTGNTAKVAALYKKYFRNAEVTLYRISKKSAAAPSPEGYDLVGIGYPVHAFNAPEPAVSFAKSLPPVAYRRTFLFKTSGEGLHLNDCSSYKLLKVLSKKGYDVISERHVVMPYNMIYRHCDEMAKQMWIYAKAIVEADCKSIESSVRRRVKQPFYKTFYAPVIGWIEQHFARLHGPMFKVDANKCTGCGRCAASCPENNITIKDGKYTFGHSCALCMGCSFNCPQSAISVGVFRFWKVNGSYRLNELAADPDICFPYVPEHARGVYRLYKKYYREIDELLSEAGVDVQSYV